MDTIIIFLLVVVVLFNIYLLFKLRSLDFSTFVNNLTLLEKNIERVERTIREEVSKIRDDSLNLNKIMREELTKGLFDFMKEVRAQISETSSMQKNQFEIFTKQLGILVQTIEQRLDRINNTVENRLKLLQDDTNKKLEDMRAVVDNRLHETLEKRLGESFKLVSERLEQVHRGLGEMQNLASSVGDLKKVLTNVKTRGIWGEIQLENLLSQILSPEQYDVNVTIKKGSNERVEFAIKLPGKNDDNGVVWLPIDAKFPQEDYYRLLDYYDKCDEKGIEEAKKQLERSIKNCAKDIKEKYINPPYTTDFGILFLPVEGLYAEVLRLPELVENLQRDYRVVIAGPTTLAAFLNSLQMGFKTLAIEKRTSEVWKLLGAVKTEFAKFGYHLEKASEKILKAHAEIDDAVKKTRNIERKLKDVQELPSDEVEKILSKD
jgi:DNA recombination protein RmuC